MRSRSQDRYRWRGAEAFILTRPVFHQSVLREAATGWACWVISDPLVQRWGWGQGDRGERAVGHWKPDYVQRFHESGGRKMNNNKKKKKKMKRKESSPL